MTRLLLAMAAVGLGGGAALAGGPPPVYVVADEVTVSADRIVIRGSFIRLEGSEYGKPVAGAVCLGLDTQKAAECRTEWAHWSKVAGTGRAVPVGVCGDGGALLKVKIHKAGAPIKTPDAVYTPGHPLGSAAKQDYAEQAPVKALLAFVKERTEARVERK